MWRTHVIVISGGGGRCLCALVQIIDDPYTLQGKQLQKHTAVMSNSGQTIPDGGTSDEAVALE